MTRLHNGTHSDIRASLLTRLGRALTSTQPATQPVNLVKPAPARTPEELLTYATGVVDQLITGAPISAANPGGWAPALDLELPHPSEVAPLHESFTKSWGELALQAHERGEHEGRRYSLVCPACRAQ